MKRLLSLFAGMTFLLASGTAYADDTMGKNDNGDRMIQNQDLLKYDLDKYPDLDQGQGTVNLTPAKPGEGGSAPGGSGEEPALKDDTGIPAPAEKTSQDPYDSERGKDDPYKAMDKNEQNTSRY